MMLTLACLLLAAPADTIALNIEPTRQRPRQSEGAFVTLADQRVLFCYTEFTGGAADESPAHLVGIESRDGGASWGAPREIVANEGGANVMSVSLLRLKSGRIALFYLKKNSWVDCRPYLRISDDEGASWSMPTLVGTAPGYFVLNNDRVVQLASGRLVMPLAWHRSRGADPHSSRSFDARAVDIWYLSDDEGKTWRESRSWWALPVASGTGLQEPGVVELGDGSLLCFARTDRGQQWEMRSTDGGETWTAPVAGPLSSPTSPASIKRLPGTNRLLAVWNDHSGRFPFPKGKRTPLVSALSDDGGKTWSRQKPIEDDPDGWYCYTALHFVGDHLLLAYCAGDSKVGGLNRLRIRRLPIAWLTARDGEG
ncbi:MAG: exo-alpha-sialidase [Armatimonadetes bacterium]|nr:exo-alpha-sialidase [Armatimonadota bacterium]